MELYLVFGETELIDDFGYGIPFDTLYGIFDNEGDATKFIDDLDKRTMLKGVEKYYISKEQLNDSTEAFKNSTSFRKE